MKKIILSTLIIGLASFVIIGGTISFLTDKEFGIGNTFTLGTIEISINDQLHWTQSFNWENIQPGQTGEIELIIKNEGDNSVKLWKIIKCLITDENDIIEPEQDWYDTYNNGQPKNDIDSVILYEMYIDGELAVAQEAGITLSQIKDHYVGLMKLDPGGNPEFDGILEPSQSITVIQKYHLPSGTQNWAQSDSLSFVLEIEARQTDAPEPLQQISFMDNKYPGWSATADQRMGILKYDYISPEFNYNFFGTGLNPAKEYCLIYAKDPWPAAKPLIDQGISDDAGTLVLSGSEDLGDLPHFDDNNYLIGAKIWLLPCDEYTGSIGWPPHDDWLFDNWPGLINYIQGDRPDEEINCDYEDNHNNNTSSTSIIHFNNLAADPQYGYIYDYSQTNVDFTYETPADDKIIGQINATNLKPYATYQVKFEGIPTCLDPVNGNDQANEYIGYKGRWNCVSGVTCTGNANARNRTDIQYESRSHYRGDGSECIVSYLVFDYFTAAASGNIEVADMSISSDTSYHVLWCDSDAGICNSNNLNTYLAYLDPNHNLINPPAVQFCPYNKVNGQPEPGRGGCHGLTLDSGIYNLKMILTEESFHQGDWATVMDAAISFEIN